MVLQIYLQSTHDFCLNRVFLAIQRVFSRSIANVKKRFERKPNIVEHSSKNLTIAGDIYWEYLGKRNRVLKALRPKNGRRPLKINKLSFISVFLGYTIETTGTK